MKARTDVLVPAFPVLGDYLALIKFRLLALVLVSTCMGYYVSASSTSSFLVLLYTLAGVLLVGGGANSLNQWKERAADALMLRTRNRPLPAQRITPNGALTFGLLISCAGFFLLAYIVNGLTALLSFLSWATYLFVYTPMKTRSVLNTWAGAVPGAIPAIVGCTAASGTLTLPALALFLILYVWQMPHFFAISWVYRDDYLRGGFRMLSWNDNSGKATARQILLHTVLLVPVSAGLYLSGRSGLIYLALALAGGLWFLYCGIRFYAQPNRATARKVFHFSIIYLPLLFAAIILDSQLTTA